MSIKSHDCLSPPIINFTYLLYVITLMHYVTPWMQPSTQRAFEFRRKNTEKLSLAW